MTQTLLAWIAAGRRDLPWRRDRRPYAVWISEIMLQQTQVATVVPYFERWLAKFPDVAALAAAPLDDVLKCWEGLGYYARARNLHRAAREIVAHHGGQLPADPAALRRLPGIGRYSAGAILSIAFGRAEPILDGNVRRVLCRVYDVVGDPRSPAVERQLWALAAALVEAAPPGKAGDLNESLMELGALICTPGVPPCLLCPLAGQCLAYQRGVQAERPQRAPAARAPHYDAVAALIQDGDGRYLMAQRPPEGLLGGLWEFPGERSGRWPAGQTGEDGLAAALVAAVAARLGIEIAAAGRVARVRHAYTHFRITLHAFRAAWSSGEPRPVGYSAVRWSHRDDLAALALPVTDLKILAAITE